MKEKLSLIIAGVCSVVSYLVGGFDPILTVFVTILLVDTVTGMIKAWNAGDYSSKKFRAGFFKKTGYLLGIILTVQVDILLGGSGLLRDTVMTFFIANESFSIIENLGEMGIGFPEQLTNAIKSLNDRKHD